ncbi:MAG: phytanoyl-CoA dioxygenase family protein [Planctomycetaceae bacterium]
MTTTQAVPITADTSTRFTTGELAAFQRDGYVIVRNLAAADLRQRMLEATFEGLAREIEPIEFEADVRYPGAPESRSVPGGRTARRLLQAHGRGKVFTDWLARPEFESRLRQLMGPDVVMPLAHHNCIMTKQPQFSSDTGWHQDVRYWSFQRPELISAWLALGEERRENGCLRLIPGTHRMTFERDRLDDALFLRTDDRRNADLLAGEFRAELQPGDVLFFHARTFHAATRNFTATPKFSVVFTFRPADNRPIPGTRSASLPELLLAGK